MNVIRLECDFMTVGMYIFLSALFVFFYLVNRDEKESKSKNLAKKIKKPDLDYMCQMSNAEIEEMYRESLEKIKAGMN